MNISLEVVVTSVLSFIIGIAIFFIKKWMSDIEDNINKVDSNSFKYSERIQTKVGELEKNLTNGLHSTDKQIEVIKSQFVYIQKKVDNIDKIPEAINTMNGKIIQIETKMEALGKVIHIVRKEKP